MTPRPRVRQISSYRVIESYTHPEKAKQLPRPLYPYDAPTTHVETSIRMTLEFLGACTPPFPDGKLMTYDDTRKDTVMWPIWNHVAHQTHPNPSTGKEFIETITTEFLFDAAGSLVVRTSFAHEGMLAKRTRPQRTTSLRYPRAVRNELLKRLQQFRWQIVQTQLKTSVPLAR